MKHNFAMKWILTVTVLTANILVLHMFGTAFIDIAKFSIAIILGTLIPGLLVLNQLGLYQNTFYRFPLAMAIGICLDIIFFILFSLVNFKMGLYLLLAGLLLWYLLSKKFTQDYKILANSFKGVSLNAFAGMSVVSLLILGLVSILYFIPNVLPGLESVVYSVDYPWHIGNIAEIKNHWFPENPRLAGYPFNYHIFFYIYIALISYITDIAIAVIFFRLYILFFFYLLLGGLYYLGSHWYGQKEIGIIFAVITIFIGTALCSHPANLFLKDLFFSPTFFLALLLFVFILNEMKKYISNRGSLLVILILLFGMIGAKGSFFPVIFAGLLVTTFYNLILSREIKRLSHLLVGGLLVFAPTFLYIFKKPGGEGLNLLPLEIVYNTAFYSYYLNLFTNVNSWVILAFIPLYLLGFFSFRLLAIADNIKDSIVKPKVIPTDNFLLISIIIISLIPAYLLSYRGNSQYFFLFAGYLALNLISASYIYKVFSNDNKKVLKIILSFLLLVGILDTVVMVNDTNITNNKLASLSRKPLSPGIYEGLTYIKENTDEDVIIGSYRVFLITEDNPRFFYYSAFAERRVVVEGYMYNPYRYTEEALTRYEDMKTLFFTRNAKEALRIINKYDIDVVIVDKRAKQRLRFDTKGILKKVFINEEIEVLEKIT